MYTVNDFFCGAGGMGLGFKQAGFRIAGSWDWDKYAVHNYQLNVDDKALQADISQMTGGDIPTANVWTFGFPCQDLSIAGNRAGLVEGKRSSMFFEIMRLLGEVKHKPEIIMAENVKELKKWLPVLKEEYAKAGYVMYAKLFNSKYWGVPQNRERWFVIGVRQDLDIDHYRYPKEQTDFIPKLSSVLESDVPEKYYINEEKAARIISRAVENIKEPTTDLQRAVQAQLTTVGEGIAYCCDANYAKGINENSLGEGRRTHIIEPDIRVIGRLDMKGKDQWKRVYDTEGLCPTLTAICGGMQEPKVLDEVKFRVRKLTPREFARLQGFPDSYRFDTSDSQVYKQMGNAVTVNVAEAQAQAIAQHLSLILTAAKEAAATVNRAE